MKILNAKIYGKSSIGKNAIIGDGVIIGYPTTTILKEATASGLEIKDMDFKGAVIGDNAVIRSNTTIYSNVVTGNNLRTGHNVFIGPCAVLSNDKYPIRTKSDLKGTILRRGASVGANSTILPGVEVGEGAMIAAGALVTKDVPPWKLAIGFPAIFKDLPEELKTLNNI